MNAKPFTYAEITVTDFEKSYHLNSDLDPEISAAILKLLQPYMDQATERNCGRIQELLLEIHFPH